MWNAVKLIALGFITLFAALASHFARDIAYQANALTVMLAAAFTFLWVLRHTDEPRVVRTDQYMDDVVRAGVIATTFLGHCRIFSRGMDRISTGFSGAEPG